MQKTILSVSGMSCQHCVAAVTKAVSALNGVKTVAVDLSAKSVTVEHDASLASGDQIKAAIEDQGYDVLGVNG